MNCSKFNTSSEKLLTKVLWYNDEENSWLGENDERFVF